MAGVAGGVHWFGLLSASAVGLDMAPGEGRRSRSCAQRAEVSPAKGVTGTVGVRANRNHSARLEQRELPARFLKGRPFRRTRSLIEPRLHEGFRTFVTIHRRLGREMRPVFDAGYYLEATYPIRSDETKGEGEFGSKTIEYDIIHVCRKRMDEPKPVSWGRMRREVMADVRQLQAMLENHATQGLPAADLQVIRRGKALEYFSRHYGKVYVDEGRTISVRDALIGINQLIDEDADKGKEAPPVNAEPMTRQFLRTFGNAMELKRDQLQKFLKGSITTPDEFVQRGWCAEKNKIFTRTGPLDFARDWSGRHRSRLTSDLDQALVLIGACYDGSGINASDTLKNENFKPHVALKPLLEWLHRNGPDQPLRNAASRAVSIYNGWEASQAAKPAQGSLFDDDEDYQR